MVKPIAEQPSRSASSTEPVTAWSLLGGQPVRRVDLQDGRDRAGEGVGAGLDHAERRGIGVEPGLDRQLEMVVRVIGRRVGREGARRAMLEALVDRQDHQLPVPPSLPSIRMRARFALVPGLSLS